MFPTNKTFFSRTRARERLVDDLSIRVVAFSKAFDVKRQTSSLYRTSDCKTWDELSDIAEYWNTILDMYTMPSVLASNHLTE